MGIFLVCTPRFIVKCDALRDLVPFIQFKKCEKHPWRSVSFNTKSITLPFHTFLNASQIKGNSEITLGEEKELVTNEKVFEKTLFLGILQNF